LQEGGKYFARYGARGWHIFWLFSCKSVALFSQFSCKVMTIILKDYFQRGGDYLIILIAIEWQVFC